CILRILVTGAFGSLGFSAVPALLRAGHSVRCFDLSTRSNRRKARKLKNCVEILWGDIRDQEAVARAVGDQEVVIHCAALLPPLSDSQPDLAREVNVNGTKLLIQEVNRISTKPRIIYPSSVTVFGVNQHLPPPRTVEDPVQATDNYSQHKILCEELIRESGLDWLIMRIGVAVDAKLKKADSEILKRMFEVSLDNRLEYVHPEDVALAMTNALDCARAWNKILLIGGGPRCQIRQRDLFKASFSAIGLKPLPDAAFGKQAYYTDWMDTSESQKYLQYQRHSFGDFRKQAHREMRFARWALFSIHPLVRWWLLRHSEAWK
ncbi:MAG: NAD(P)-dependent oxidoreductase, partial [Pseudomonadota bacterium]